MIEGFDYQNFAHVLSSQADELLPANFNDDQKKYVINTISNFSTLAGEALYNDSAAQFSAEQAMLITQIIAEWSFHKSVDLIKSGVDSQYWDGIMQKIAFTIFEIAKQTISQGLPQDQVLQIVEQSVQTSYNAALDELRMSGVIDEELLDRATHQSNIDDMMEQLQTENIHMDESGVQQPVQQSDSKILKLASVAILLKRVSQDKVQTILNKFDPQDAQSVIEYMQMSDLEQRVDKNIAVKCLKEIKMTLPEPRQINPNKVIARLKKVLAEKDKSKVEAGIRKERPFVKRFVSSAGDEEHLEIPSRVANIIVQYIEERV